MAARTKSQLDPPRRQSQRTRSEKLITGPETDEDDDKSKSTCLKTKGKPRGNARRKGIKNNNNHNTKTARRGSLCKLKSNKQPTTTKLNDAVLLQIFTFANTGFNQKQIVDLSGLSKASVSKIFKDYWKKKSTDSSSNNPIVDIKAGIELQSHLELTSPSSSSRKPALRSCCYRQDMEHKKSVRFLDLSV